MSNVMFAFLLTLFAGLATGIGSCLAFFAKKTNTKFLSTALGFSAGVMIYVSFVEIILKSRKSLVLAMGDVKGNWITVISFFGGMLFIALVDKLIPSYENPHEIRDSKELDSNNIKKREDMTGLYRMGIFSAIAIGIHNFPEGLATFISALEDPTLGISIAIAIAIHNIPEGIAVSVPIYYSTGSKKKAFIYSFLSGLSEPVGALLGYIILMPFINDMIFGIIFAGVAGIMVFISLDELLPAAENYGEHHLSMYGLISGMMVMALSLLLFL
nr:zinc transporter ZupT [uncultured Cetobacterium sp.]